MDKNENFTFKNDFLLLDEIIDRSGSEPIVRSNFYCKKGHCISGCFHHYYSLSIRSKRNEFNRFLIPPIIIENFRFFYTFFSSLNLGRSCKKTFASCVRYACFRSVCFIQILQDAQVLHAFLFLLSLCRYIVCFWKSIGNYKTKNNLCIPMGFSDEQQSSYYIWLSCCIS